METRSRLETARRRGLVETVADWRGWDRVEVQLTARLAAFVVPTAAAIGILEILKTVAS